MRTIRTAFNLQLFHIVRVPEIMRFSFYPFFRYFLMDCTQAAINQWANEIALDASDFIIENVQKRILIAFFSDLSRKLLRTNASSNHVRPVHATTYFHFVCPSKVVSFQDLLRFIPVIWPLYCWYSLSDSDDAAVSGSAMQKTGKQEKQCKIYKLLKFMYSYLVEAHTSEHVKLFVPESEMSHN